MNKNVFFDYQLNYDTIVSEKKKHDFSSINEIELFRIAQGKIFIFFEEQRNFIIIEDSILSYLKQIKFALRDIDEGNFTAFTVSTHDWFSNNIRFTYDDKSSNLRLFEMNNHDFDIQITYLSFKNIFNKFSKKCISQIIEVYPELLINENFLKMREDNYFFF
ncbi:hypothetical protein ACX0HA_12485 [Flavobacterium hauense]